jgi:UDP-N-acetylglucosamine 2-epimerase
VREGSFLGVPAVNVGKRQTFRERGHNVVDVGHDRKTISAAIERQVRHGRYSPDFTYGDGKAGERIAQLLATEPLKFEKVLSYVLET